MKYDITESLHTYEYEGSTDKVRLMEEWSSGRVACDEVKRRALDCLAVCRAKTETEHQTMGTLIK